MSEIRALTVQQPWAWAIVRGGKTVENRTQAWTYRGPLAIHAGARWSDRGGQLVAHPGLEDEEMHFGALIGVVDLVDVHREHGCCAPWGEQTYGDRDIRLVHLVLENPRPLAEPIYCRGRLGLWTVEVPDA